MDSVDDFLDSVFVQELDTLPAELMEELERDSQFAELFVTENFWGDDMPPNIVSGK